MGAKKRRILVALVALATFSGSSEFASAYRAAPAVVSPPTQPYLMSFHSCATGATDCNNPANHVVQLAQSADGVSWSLVSGWQSYRGSVPDVFRRGNTLYIISTGGLTKVDLTNGSTSTSQVTLSEGTFVDQSLAQLPDGRLILFFLPGVPGQDPAQCAAGEASCVRQIRSAVEVAGSDGTRFTVESGARVSETITGGVFSDPDIFFNGTEWVLYVSRGPSVHAYTSTNLQGSYVFRGVVSNNLGGVPAGLRLNDGTVVTYVHTSVGASTEIRRAASSSGTSSIGAFQTALTGSALGLGSHAESPGLAHNVAGIDCSSCSSTSPSTTVAPSANSSAIRIGASCPKAGESSTVGKTKVVCKKSGKKLVWAKR